MYSSTQHTALTDQENRPKTNAHMFLCAVRLKTERVILTNENTHCFWMCNSVSVERHDMVWHGMYCNFVLSFIAYPFA